MYFGKENCEIPENGQKQGTETHRHEGIKDDIKSVFEQIINDMYGDKMLIIAGQLPVEDWYNVFHSELITNVCRSGL